MKTYQPTVGDRVRITRKTADGRTKFTKFGTVVGPNDAYRFRFSEDMAPRPRHVCRDDQVGPMFTQVTERINF